MSLAIWAVLYSYGFLCLHIKREYCVVYRACVHDVCTELVNCFKRSRSLAVGRLVTIGFFADFW